MSVKQRSSLNQPHEAYFQSTVQLYIATLWIWTTAKMFGTACSKVILESLEIPVDTLFSSKVLGFSEILKVPKCGGFLARLDRTLVIFFRVVLEIRI